MKKLSAALLLSAMVTSAYATTSTATGFYLGANLGGSNTNAKYTLSNNNDVASKKTAGTGGAGTPITAGSAVAKPVNDKKDAGKLGAVFGLFTGYGYQMGQGYVGAELFFNGESTDTKVRDALDNSLLVLHGNSSPTTRTSVLQNKTTVKKKMGYGFALRFGMFATPSTLAYIKLGLEGGQYKAKSDFTGSQLLQAAREDNNGRVFATDALRDAVTEPVKEKKKNSLAFAPGVGLEAYLNKNMFVRAEYTYVFGPKIKFDQNKDGLDFNDLSTQYRHEFKVSQNRFTLGLGYKF